WASINSATGMISLAPTDTDAGQFTITVQVSDGELTHETSLSVTVPFKPIVQPWSFDDGLDFISENAISLVPKQIKTIEEVSVTKIATVPVQSLDANGRVTYKFHDIVFEKTNNNEFNLINKTPMKVKELIVRVYEAGAVSNLLLAFDSELDPFSSTQFYLPRDVSEIELDNKFNMHLPTVTFAGNVSAEEGKLCTSFCYSVPDEQQGNVYKILSSNTHISFNHKELLPQLINFYKERCADPANNCVPEVAVINYLKKGNHGHRFQLKVLSGNYVNEGVGGGGSPDLEQMVSDSGGWASIWYAYITDTHAAYRPFKGATYKTIFHEGAHGYGFSHPTGMTYGFAEIYGFEFIQNFISEQNRETVNTIKNPHITANIVDKGNHYIKYKLDSLPNVNISTLSARILSPEKISREGRFSIEEDGVYFEIKLGAYPIKPVIIQFYTDSGDFTASERINPNQFYSLTPVMTINGLDYYDLPAEVTTDANYSWSNGRCSRFVENSKGATRNQINAAWSSANYSPELLRAKNYISSNASAPYKRWKIDMTNTVTFTATSEPNGTVMTPDEGFLCVKTQP
ncbi:TPA: Ig domain-containing protein, partial [Photobacterium damselae]